MVEQALLTALKLALQIGIGLAKYLFPALRAVLHFARCWQRRTLGGSVFLVELVGKFMQYNLAAIIHHRCAIQGVLP